MPFVMRGAGNGGPEALIPLENQGFEWEKTFTQKKQLSFGSWLAAWQDSTRGAETSDLRDGTLRRGLREQS